MSVVTLLMVALWLAGGVLVFRFVKRTGGYSEVGRVAHWFGGAFVMIGLALGLTWIHAQIDHDFGNRANVYVLTHQIRPGDNSEIIRRNISGTTVTVFRRGTINTATLLNDAQLTIDESTTIRTSLWWMLWGKM